MADKRENQRKAIVDNYYERKALRNAQDVDKVIDCLPRLAQLAVGFGIGIFAYKVGAWLFGAA